MQKDHKHVLFFRLAWMITRMKTGLATLYGLWLGENFQYLMAKEINWINRNKFELWWQLMEIRPETFRYLKKRTNIREASKNLL